MDWFLGYNPVYVWPASSTIIVQFYPVGGLSAEEPSLDHTKKKQTNMKYPS